MRTNFQPKYMLRIVRIGCAPRTKQIDCAPEFVVQRFGAQSAPYEVS